MKSVVNWKVLSSTLVLAIGIIRLMEFVLHEPVFGYGNNTDMVRMQACLQLWPDDPNVEPGSPTFSAPLPFYKLVDTLSQEHLCIPSSELIWLRPLVDGLRIADVSRFPTQLLGVTRATLITLAAVAFHVFLCLRRELRNAVAHSLIFALVIADPANTLYFNTFYTEFAALFSLYISFIALWVTFSVNSSNWLSIPLGLAVALMGLSKYQHILLPLVFVLFAVIGGRKKMTRWNLATLFLALGVTGCYYRFAPEFSRAYPSYSYYINYANATDSILGAILPATTDPAWAGSQLGLPSRCIQYSGVTWYTPSVQEEHPCPEVLEVNRLRILVLALRDSRFLLNITGNALGHLRPWVLDYLGAVGEGDYHQITIHRTSLSALLDRLSSGALAFGFGTPLAIAAILLISQARLEWTNRREALFLFCMILSGYVIFYSALFGDGFIEFAKHATLYFSIQASLIIITTVHLPSIAMTSLRLKRIRSASTGNSTHRKATS